ncbi:Phenylacetone monooxygenase (PAMO) (Baeyer-Villiger monooxygenase) (BVMO) [Durusdinium trenchii]|uniref:Phenylacetone monooxygenase (PAMO) (Baeyer-Villiger monooxygenase) (BVMO) n=1 Tax=Durusdinium trenchii TaxID=1381693 RepID=A0ABP0LZS1_9DINO
MAANEKALRRASDFGFGAWSNDQGVAMMSYLLTAKAQGSVCLALKHDLQFWPHGQMFGPSSWKAALPQDSLESQIHRVIADLLNDEVSLDADLNESGLDSLGAAEMARSLSAQFGMKLPATLLTDAPTEKDLQAYIRKEMASQSRPQGSPAVQRTTLVVGAGVGGVAFAQQLVRAGERVIVMERSAEAGGCWSLGNTSSQLQIDSPSYMLDYEQPFPWQTTYPSKQQVMAQVSSVAHELPDLRLRHTVHSVETLARGEYLVRYSDDLNQNRELRVDGVACFLGGLHRPNDLRFPGEEHFAGPCKLGHADDVPPAAFKGKDVLIVGHGAFAVENLRTALQNNARSVIMVARRRNVVFPTVVNWLINSVDKTLSIRAIRPILAQFYAAVGLTLEDLPGLDGDSIDFRIPACSDIYFLAQAMGVLKVIIGEVDHIETDAVASCSVDSCDIFLKCLGFHRDDLVRQIFGRDLERNASFWINGDPNLVANDQFQVPERVNSLLCPSYPFYVQAFAKAFLYYRNNPEVFEKTKFAPGVDVTIMWEHFGPTKEKVAQVTAHQLPFHFFVAQRREDWIRNVALIQKNRAPLLSVADFDELLRPASAMVARLWPTSLQNLWGALTVPRRLRVLFFHGQKTDAAIAYELLKRQGWLTQTMDFVIFDGPHSVLADTDDEQLQRVGLTQLVEEMKYVPGGEYKEWCANFDIFFDIHMKNEQRDLSSEEEDLELKRYEEAFVYLKQHAKSHGPFDAVAGFCQGAAFAQAALWKQQQSDIGLGEVRMMIAMAPWQCPYHEKKGCFQQPLDMPLLLLHGRKDLEMFKQAAPIFGQSFNKRTRTLVEFEGAHAYPPLNRSQNLRNAVDEFLDSNWLPK